MTAPGVDRYRGVREAVWRELTWAVEPAYVPGRGLNERGGLAVWRKSRRLRAALAGIHGGRFRVLAIEDAYVTPAAWPMTLRDCLRRVGAEVRS